MTLDGGGDGLSGSVYLGRAGQLQKLAEVDSFNSLGNFYSYITAMCGFKAERHEGKITGLAAYGKPVYADILLPYIYCFIITCVIGYVIGGGIPLAIMPLAGSDFTG